MLATCEQNNRESFPNASRRNDPQGAQPAAQPVDAREGLVANDTSVSDLPWGELRGPRVYVVDVANVEPEAQDLIFARIVTEARERLERNGLGGGPPHRVRG